jgi:hypothetical protein
MERLIVIGLVILAILAVVLFGESGSPAIIDWCRGCY